MADDGFVMRDNGAGLLLGVDHRLLKILDEILTWTGDEMTAGALLVIHIRYYIGYYIVWSFRESGCVLLNHRPYVLQMC